MRARLGELLDDMSVDSTQAIGIDPDAVEAITFAWLAYCRVNNLEIDLETITGAKQRQLPGGIYKAANNPGS